MITLMIIFTLQIVYRANFLIYIFITFKEKIYQNLSENLLLNLVNL